MNHLEYVVEKLEGSQQFHQQDLPLNYPEMAWEFQPKKLIRRELVLWLYLLFLNESSRRAAQDKTKVGTTLQQKPNFGGTLILKISS